jgi:hypothetical protein
MTRRMVIKYLYRYWEKPCSESCKHCDDLWADIIRFLYYTCKQEN